MDVICNDDNLIDVVQMSGLIDTRFDSKELSFSGCNIDGMMDYLDN